MAVRRYRCGVMREPSPGRGPRVVAMALALQVASALCLGLLLIRVWHTESLFYGFLVWNLVLAWVPFGLAWVMMVLDRRRASGLVLVGVGALWLLFFPNAPYVVTDFVHLGKYSSGIPLWYDALLIGSFAAVSLIMGLASLGLVQSVVTRRAGAGTGWAVTVVAIGLCAMGVYLGRVHRFNSWDAILDPSAILSVVIARLSDPLGNPAMLIGVGLFSLALLGSYVASRSAVQRIVPTLPGRPIL